MLSDKKFKVKKGKKIQDGQFKKKNVFKQIAVDEKPSKPFPRNKNKISGSPQSPAEKPTIKQWFDSRKASFKHNRSRLNTEDDTKTPLSPQSPAEKPTIQQWFDSRKASFKRKRSRLNTEDDTKTPLSPQSPAEKPTIKQLFDSRNASFKHKRSRLNTEDETKTSNMVASKAKKMKHPTAKIVPEEMEEESLPHKKVKTSKVPRFLEESLNEKPDRKEQRRLRKIAKQRAKTEEDRLKQTVFIGNLPMSITRKGLEKLFSRFGAVESVRLRGAIPVRTQIPKKIADITRHFHKGLHSRKGFIVFKYADSTTAALSLNGTLIDDHHIIVDKASGTGEKKTYDNKRTIFVGNLPFDVDDETVWNAFSSCGEVEAVRVIRDKTTGAGKGFGYVLFQTKDSKEAAISKENLEIKGRIIRIKSVQGSQKQKGPKQQNFKRGLALKAKSRKENPQSRKSTKKLLKKEKVQFDKKKIASNFKKFL